MGVTRPASSFFLPFCCCCCCCHWRSSSEALQWQRCEHWHLSEHPSTLTQRRHTFLHHVNSRSTMDSHQRHARLPWLQCIKPRVLPTKLSSPSLLLAPRWEQESKESFLQLLFSWKFLPARSDSRLAFSVLWHSQSGSGRMWFYILSHACKLCNTQFPFVAKMRTQLAQLSLFFWNFMLAFSGSRTQSPPPSFYLSLQLMFWQKQRAIPARVVR